MNTLRHRIYHQLWIFFIRRGMYGAALAMARAYDALPHKQIN